jgi:hypothetical protein
MFTVFHVLVIAGLVVGGAVGADVGWKLLGTAGGIVGAVVGAIAGLYLGNVPYFLVRLSIARALAAKTTAELKADLHSPDCLIPNFVLLELRRRGQDIRRELPLILDLLVSENVGRRSHGWAALTSAFPELAEQIGDYRLGDSVDECRRKTEILRHAD